MRRRTLLLGLGGLTGIAAFSALGRWRYWNSQVEAIDRLGDLAVVGEASLRDRAANKKLIYGAESQYKALASDPEYAASFVRESAMLVPGLELKWQTLRATPDRFNFDEADWMANFASTHNLLFRGHTLVWHNVLPEWVKKAVNRQNAEQFLTNHIETVVKRYAGKMHSWDVVNEAIEPADGRPDKLRKLLWLEHLGPDYIDLSFRVASAADPKAMLVYNDYGLEYDTNDDEIKRRAVLKLLENLKSRGTPIHALGVQSHLWGHRTQFNPKKVRDFFREVAGLGLKIMVTEMDLIDQRMPSDVTMRDRLIAKAYYDFLSVALEEPAVIAVITWGLSDRYTWISSFYPRADGAPVRPLPLDAQLKRKLVWNAMARAFDTTSSR